MSSLSYGCENQGYSEALTPTADPTPQPPARAELDSGIHMYQPHVTSSLTLLAYTTEMIPKHCQE